MAEYIEREAVNTFLQSAREREHGTPLAMIDWFHSVVSQIPAAEVAPVVHGEWVEKPFLLGTSNFCSLCDSFYGMPHGKFNYCPNCGAKMDK